MSTSSGSASYRSTATVAEVLREIGALLGVEPANRFRARAYERGASAVAALSDDELCALIASGRLTSVPGIGAALARTIAEIVDTGRSEFLDRLRERYPPGAPELSLVLPLARIKTLHGALGIASLEELRAACKAGRVRGVRGFGERTERRLLARIDALGSRREGVILAKAASDAQVLLDHLRRQTTVLRAEVAGPFRRRVEVIDALDLVVSSDDPGAVAHVLRRAPGAVALKQVRADRFLVHRPSALDTAVRVVSAGDFVGAWWHDTGSAAHVEKLARLASDRGFELDDRGLCAAAERLPVASESELYARLGLDFVPPELREDAGEIESAADGRIPADLVTVDDIQGAVHCHTVYSDGKHGVEEMARAADALGLAYLTITDHSASATYARGLELDRLRRQGDEIARVQEKVAVRLLRGTESDILRDGSLDYPDAVLESLDVVIASIHNRYGMDADEMTRRVVRALRHPLFKIWGHPLGRYVLSRPPFAVHMDEVLDAAASARVAIEVNGDPHRLDLEPRWIREASRRGIRFVVSTDAHSISGLANRRWGVDMARRGWLRRGDVLNTLGADAFAAAVRP